MSVFYNLLFVTAAFLAFVLLDYPRSILIPLIRQYKKVLYKDDKFSVFVVFLCDNISWIISTGIFMLDLGTLPYLFFYVGVAFMIFGFLLRQWSITELGRYFSPTIRIIKKHKIIETGPYRYIRHPSYTGMLLFLLGMALASRSIDSIFIGMLLPLFGYTYRINMEEKSLIAHLKTPYLKYMDKTKKLVPFIY